MFEGDGARIGRPRELGDVIPGVENLLLVSLAIGRGLHGHEVEGVGAGRAVDDAEVPLLLFRLLLVRGRVEAGEGDPFTIGRDLILAEFSFEVGELLRLPARDGNAVDVCLAGARGAEADGAAIGSE